ncbi:hypothetical protein LXL04_003994 [Taraxacum kok-saghyz]
MGTLLMSVSRKGQETQGVEQCCNELQNVEEECQQVEQMETQGRRQGGRQTQDMQQIVENLRNQCILQVQQYRIPSAIIPDCDKYDILKLGNDGVVDLAVDGGAEVVMILQLVVQIGIIEISLMESCSHVEKVKVVEIDLFKQIGVKSFPIFDTFGIEPTNLDDKLLFRSYKKEEVSWSDLGYLSLNPPTSSIAQATKVVVISCIRASR